MKLLANKIKPKILKIDDQRNRYKKILILVMKVQLSYCFCSRTNYEHRITHGDFQADINCNLSNRFMACYNNAVMALKLLNYSHAFEK